MVFWAATAMSWVLEYGSVGSLPSPSATRQLANASISESAPAGCTKTLVFNRSSSSATASAGTTDSQAGYTVADAVHDWLEHGLGGLMCDGRESTRPRPSSRHPRASALTMNVHRVMPLVVGPSVGGVRCGSGPFPALRGEDVGVAGVGVAPAQIRLQPTRQRRVVRVVGGAHGEVRTARSGPRSGSPRTPRSGSDQLDLVADRPGPDGGGLVRRQVVHDHVDGCTVRAGRPDRLERRQGVIPRLSAAGDTPQLVVADAVAAVE